MKKIILSMFLLGTLLSANAQVPGYVPSNGLVGWWPFNGNANDQSGTAKTGTVTGATLVMDRKNNANQAYSFSPSTTSKIELKSTPTTISNTFTISIWVKPNRTINLISESNACPGTTNVPMANSNQNWAYTPTSAKIGVGISIGTNAVLVAEHAANLLICRMGYTTTINAFVHVIVTYANDSTKLYINGKLVRSRPTLCTTVHNIIEPHQLGMALYSPNFSGIIDDFGIWNRALDSNEIKSIYSGSTANVQNDNSNSKIKVYPNPAKDHLVIDFGNYSSMAGYSITIFDVAGKSVYSSAINKASETIDLNTWTGKGVYFIKIYDKQSQQIENRKIVIQ